MLRSFRWRLRIWHTLTLVVVISAFASLLYWNVRSSRLGEVDSQLLGGAQLLAAAIRGLPPHELTGDPTPPRDAPPDRDRLRAGPGDESGERRSEEEAAPPGDNAAYVRSEQPPPPGRPAPPGARSRDHRFAGRRPPPHRRPPRAEFDLPTPEQTRRHVERVLADLALPGTLQPPPDDPGGPAYFAIWRTDGEILKASTPAPQVSLEDLPADLLDGEFIFERRRDRREVVLGGPELTLILVGRPIGREIHELNSLAAQLAMIGILVTTAGIVGGAVLARHVVQPLEEMSATAASISAANLSERIDPTTFDCELQGLAGTLNETFARLEAAFERQSRFTADASHELRTPLAVLTSHLEYALSRKSLDADQRESLEACQRACRRMKSLVDALLLLARADAGGLAAVRQSCDLASIVEECVDMLRPLAAEKRVEVVLHADDACEFDGDPALAAQLAMNLVGNAIHYNRPDGRVTVSVHSEDADALLVVEDTGPGIPLEDQPHLFERFYRVDQSRSREDGGNGLGLSIAKSIVDAHGGKISFTSQPGEGSRFEVRLPLHAPRPATRTAPIE
jgi:heavy metal sensor kinase